MSTKNIRDAYPRHNTGIIQRDREIVEQRMAGRPAGNGTQPLPEPSRLIRQGKENPAVVRMSRKPEKMLPCAPQTLGLPPGLAELSRLKKSDGRKTQLAILLRTHTSVGNEWIAARLAMGHPGSVSRTVSAGRTGKTMAKAVRNLEKVLIREQ